MSLSYLFDPNKQFQDEAGNNNVDGFLRVYIDGTDDRAITYKDFDGTLNLSDITLDINGRAVVIVDRSKTYRLEVYKRDGGMLWTARPMIPSYEGGGGIDPEDLKDLVIKHGGRTSGTYRPMVGATIDIPKSCEAVSELEENLYGKITSIISDFRTPVLMKSDLDPEIPGVTRDFYYWPTARTGADGNYSFVGYDGVRAEIVTVHGDNSVSYRTVSNSVHRLMEVSQTDDDPAPYGFWIVDLEKPNPNAPCGYEWAYVHDILEGLRNGDVFVLYPYYSFVTNMTSPVMHMTKIEDQSGVDSQGNHYEAVRIFFDSCSYTGQPGRYAATSIYTPDKYGTSHTGRMAILDWQGVSRQFMNFELADDDTVEHKNNKVQSLDNNSSHYPSCPAVKEAIDTAVASAYHAAGTKTVAQLTSALLVADNQGNVYNITDSGTTTADFVDGAGHPIVAGDNVGVCDVGDGVYKFDLLSGFVDISGYLAKTGDGSNVTSTFTKASGDTSSIASGGKLSAIFTAISNFFSTIASHIANTSNPHNVTKTQVGLGDVDNTSDLNKPVSTAMQAALNTKANDSSVVHLAGAETITGIKTFSGNYGPVLKNASFMCQTALLPCGPILPYNNWTAAQKDDNHYRQWEIDITSLVNSYATYACVQVSLKSSWNAQIGNGILKKSISCQIHQASVVTNIGEYVEANGNTAQYFRISDVIKDNNKYVIRIVNAWPASDNYPTLLKVDYLKTSNGTQPTITESIIEGWPAWAGTVGTLQRITCNGTEVMLVGDPVPWSNISGKPAAVNVNQVDHNTETSSFTFVNGHIYHLTVYLQGSPLVTSATSSGTGYVVAYIGSSIYQNHYACEQFVDIQRGELTTKNIRLPIDWKAENITDSTDNQLHVAVIFNNTRYGFTSVSNYKLTLMGTDFNGS